MTQWRIASIKGARATVTAVINAPPVLFAGLNRSEVALDADADALC